MEISASLVKELRERTSASMMECKKALVESGGNIEAAIEIMRKAGHARAAKKAERIANEGIIVIQQRDHHIAMVEVNCETDFVSKGDDFRNFCAAIAATLLETHPATIADLLSKPFAGKTGAKTVEETRTDLIAKIGENINVRRFILLETTGESNLGVYLHGTRIGVLVDMRGGQADLAKDVAMHIAASRPLCIAADQVSPDAIAKEKEIYIAQAAETKKPANVIEKIVEGRVQKFLNEVTLLGQPFVKNPDLTVQKLLEQHQAKVVRFERFEVGEGIEKETKNFADEVQSQVKGCC